MNIVTKYPSLYAYHSPKPPVDGRPFVNRRDVGVSDFSGFTWPWDSCPETDASYTANITAASVPDCGNVGARCFWDTPHWIAWYNAILASNNGDVATTNATWGSGWMNCRGVTGAFGHEWYIANNDPTFSAFVIANGLDKSVPDLSLMASEAAGAQKVVDTAGNLADLVKNASKTAADTTKSADTIAKYLPWILLGVGAVVVGLIIFVVVKKQSFKIV